MVTKPKSKWMLFVYFTALTNCMWIRWGCILYLGGTEAVCYRHHRSFCSFTAHSSAQSVVHAYKVFMHLMFFNGTAMSFLTPVLTSSLSYVEQASSVPWQSTLLLGRCVLEQIPREVSWAGGLRQLLDLFVGLWQCRHKKNKKERFCFFPKAKYGFSYSVQVSLYCWNQSSLILSLCSLFRHKAALLCFDGLLCLKLMNKSLRVLCIRIMSKYQNDNRCYMALYGMSPSLHQLTLQDSGWEWRTKVMTWTSAKSLNKPTVCAQ